MSNLAVLGAPPLFDEIVTVGMPNIPDRQRFLRLMEGALDDRRLTNDGPLVRRLEDRAREITGAEHVVAVANGTIGLEITAVGLALEGPVVVPSFTFIATAHGLRWVGAQPVFADVDPLTHNLDPVDVEQRIPDDLAALVAVHLWGQPADVEALAAIAEAHHVPLVLDAAHALGSRLEGRPVGRFGRAEIFSLHATKFVNSFEGGLVTTDDADLAFRLRQIRNFGFDDSGASVRLGVNAKMSEASAAMGLVSLDAMDRIVERNRANHEAYRSVLAGIPGIRFMEYEPDTTNYQYVVLEIRGETTGIDADAVQAALLPENVYAKRYFTPACHASGPYAAERSPDSHPLPVTDRLSREVLVLPTGLAVTPEMAEDIGRRLEGIVARSEDVTARLAATD